MWLFLCLGFKWRLSTIRGVRAYTVVVDGKYVSMQFELRLDKILSMTDDGAAVMVKIGILVEAEHQLCMVHGIQLAVVDVLYKKAKNNCSASDANHEGTC